MYKKYIFILLLIIIVLPLAVSCSQTEKDSNVAYYTCPMHPQIHEDHSGQCPICGMNLIPVKKEITTQNHNTTQKEHTTHAHSQNDKTLYTCPMHPTIKEEHSGQCPICGMDLVPLKTETKINNEHGVLINPTYTQNIGVKTQQVIKRDLVKSIKTHGKVAHDANLWVAQNEYIQAVKLGDKSLIKSAELKLEYMGLSKDWIALLKENKKADLSLHLEQKNGPSFFEAYIYQNDISFIKEGQDVAILDQKGRYLDTGKIMAISTMANLNTRSIRILIESTKNLNLKLNTFVRFQIKLPLGSKLSVNKNAILFNGDHNIVYIKKKTGLFVPTEIQLGEQAGNYYEVLSGLNEGDWVVTNGTFLIDSEAQIKLGSTREHSHK